MHAQFRARWLQNTVFMGTQALRLDGMHIYVDNKSLWI